MARKKSNLRFGLWYREMSGGSLAALGKHFTRKADGSVHIEPPSTWVTRYQRHDAAGVDDIANLQRKYGGRIYLTSGTVANMRLCSVVSTGREVEGVSVSRSKRDVGCRSGSGTYILCDVDTKWRLKSVDLAPGAVYEYLCRAQSDEFHATRVLVARSSSSAVHVDGEPLREGNCHLYWAVADAVDYIRYSEALWIRLGLCGGVWVAVTRAGTFIERGVLDRAALQPWQPTFLGPVVEGTGLTVAHDQTYFGGDAILDSRSLASPTVAERGDLRVLLDMQRRRLERKRRAIQSAWEAEYIDRQVSGGMKRTDARRYAQLVREGSALPAGHVLYLSSPDEVVRVQDVLDDPERYDRRRCKDPIEPTYDDGRAVGKLFLTSSPARLVSFAHNSVGTRYRLLHHWQRIEDFL